MVTALKLLIAATEVVDQAGFAGLRIDQVAQHAGVNKRMIYAHYGDRAGLQAAVFTNALWSLAQRQGYDPALTGFAADLLQTIERTDTRLPLLARRPVPVDARVVLLGLLRPEWSSLISQVSLLPAADAWQRVTAQWLQAVLPELHQIFLDDSVSEYSHTRPDTNEALKQKPRYRLSSRSVRR